MFLYSFFPAMVISSFVILWDHLVFVGTYENFFLYEHTVFSLHIFVVWELDECHGSTF